MIQQQFIALFCILLLSYSSNRFYERRRLFCDDAEREKLKTWRLLYLCLLEIPLIIFLCANYGIFATLGNILTQAKDALLRLWQAIPGLKKS